MARTLAIHLGDFKTGTTAIQDRPDMAGPAGGIALLPGAPHLAAARAHGAAGEALWAGIGRAAEAAEAPVALVSSEHFEFADPAALAALLARALPGWAGRIRLVAYVRPHASAFLARYAESIKIGSFEGPPEAYLDWPQTGRRMSYAPRFGRWRAAFGDAFELRLYDPEAFPGGAASGPGADPASGPASGSASGPDFGPASGDVRRDLAAALTGADPGPLPPPRAANPAPGTHDLALARALHRAMTGAMAEVMTGSGDRAQGARWTLGRAIGREMAAEAGGGPPLALDRPLARALAARFSEDAAALDAAFFPGTRPLSAALDAACRTAPAATPRPDPETLPPDLARAARIWGRTLAAALARDPAATDRLWHEQAPGQMPEDAARDAPEPGSKPGPAQAPAQAPEGAASLSPAPATAYDRPPERQDGTPR